MNLHPLLPCYLSPMYGSDVGGAPFSDDLTRVVRMLSFSVCSGDRIDMLTATYELTDGTTVTCSHGRAGGPDQRTHTLEDGERIIKVSGKIVQVNGSWRVGTLTITTNMSAHGPFGNTGTNDFSIEASAEYPICGFYGRSGWELDAIGALLPVAIDPTTIDIRSDGTLYPTHCIFTSPSGVVFTNHTQTEQSVTVGLNGSPSDGLFGTSNFVVDDSLEQQFEQQAHAFVDKYTLTVGDPLTVGAGTSGTIRVGGGGGGGGDDDP